MMRRPWVTATLLASLVVSCGFIGAGDGSDLSVTVVAGIEEAPADLGQSNVPLARYLQESNSVVFVSGFMYSSSCTPDGQATQQGEIVTLTVDDEHDGMCTADAGRATFTIENVSGAPSQLLVQQKGQEDLRLDLTA